MTSPNYYQLAKQGEPDAIAIYLNEKLSDRCLTTQAKRNEECLVLEIAVKTVGDHETVVELVRQELTALKARSITKVQIRATQENQKVFLWEAEFDLEYPQPLPKLDLSLALEDEEEEPKDGLHQTGDVIRDRYRILEVLGQGGNGITYAAEDLQQKTKVAIKALSLRHMNDWKQIELFEREAKVLSQLDHPAIPKYFDYFTIDTDEDRAFYIVQELAQGQNLAKLVEAGWRTNEKGVRKIIEQVLNILIYLHGLKPPVVHRDIKPHNLIYSNDGKVSLVDFGAVQDTYRSTMARGSTVIGTFGYMAPEQFRSQAVPATDLYALGATILFILTHRSPSELPQERLRYNFRSKIQVSEQFADWLQKMVEPEIESRYDSAKKALEELKKPQNIFIPKQILDLKKSGIVLIVVITVSTILNSHKWFVLNTLNIYPCNLGSPIAQERNREDLNVDINLIIASRERARLIELNDYLQSGGRLDRSIGENCQSAPIVSNMLTYIIKHNSKESIYLLLNQKNKNELTIMLFERIIINISSKISLKIFNLKDFLHDNYVDEINMIELILNKGADVNSKDVYGRTLLHISMLHFLNNHKYITSELKRMKYEKTPIDIDINLAIYKKIIDLLIRKGADINAKDNQGKTPLDYDETGEIKDFLKININNK